MTHNAKRLNAIIRAKIIGNLIDGRGDGHGLGGGLRPAVGLLGEEAGLVPVQRRGSHVICLVKTWI